MPGGVSVNVRGVGLWMPGFPDTASWLAQRPVAGADAPPAPGNQRRRASLLVNMVAEVAAQASRQAGVDLSRLQIVVGSAFGELATLVAMLDERERDGVLSPLRFQNSVHNAAAGLLSIAHANKSPAMSLAAGNDTAAMVLLEAFTLLAQGPAGDGVIAIVADEALPQSIRPGHHASAIAAALVLTRAAAGAADSTPVALGVLEDLRQSHASSHASSATAEPPLEVDGPTSAILPLIAALGHGRPGRVSVSPAEDPRWSITLRDAPGISGSDGSRGKTSA
jgi:hypothetical protein